MDPSSRLRVNASQLGLQQWMMVKIKINIKNNLTNLTHMTLRKVSLMLIPMMMMMTQEESTIPEESDGLEDEPQDDKMDEGDTKT